ncbi:MAG: tetratricopeptide repeat protein, partial [Puniceicoccales bacterium]
MNRYFAESREPAPPLRTSSAAVEFSRPLNLLPILALLLLGMISPAFAQIDDLSDFPLDENPLSNRTEALRNLESGERAVKTGLSAIGIELLLPLTNDSLLTPEEQNDAFLSLLTALIQMDRPGVVTQLIRERGYAENPSIRLRWAMADFLLGHSVQTRNRLRGISPENLPAGDLPWYYFLQGLLADRLNDPERAAELFGIAAESTDSPFLLDTFDAIRARLDILRGQVDEATVISLKNQYESAVALPMRLQLAREYALVLMGLGRTQEAVTFLETFSQTTEADDSAIADEILLPLAVFRGLSTPEGKATLWEILRTGTDRDTLRIALNLLLRDIGEPKPAQANTIAAIIDSRPNHPIHDRLLFAQAELLSRLGDQSTAMALVEELLDEYPGSQIRQAARLSSAFLAWQQDPPQYRTAAARLLEVIPQLPVEDRPFYLQLVGDLYFQNGDYSSASFAYRQAWTLTPTEETAFQYTLAMLETGLTPQVLEWRNANVAGNEIISREVRWRIDWNLARTMIRDGLTDEALTLIEEILQEEDLPPSTRHNFDWLEAYTLSLTGRDEEALAQIDNLLASLSQPTTADSPPIDTQAVASILAQTLLLKGEILFKNGETEQGTQVMNDLRTRFPNRRATVLSYLFEARYFAGRDLTGQAQQRLVNLADRFPESDYAPLALFEAAVIAESRGTPESVS